MTKKVLLCDDEIHILKAAELKVSRAGYDVRIARDGEQAWQMIQEDQPDVLVTDVQMPRCDGFQLSQRIRQDDRTRELPILMLTAKGFELEQQELMERWGIIDIVAKPFSPRELVRRIDAVVAESAAEHCSADRAAGQSGGTLR
jgi:DNA-binding response OmpR family regulator